MFEEFPKILSPNGIGPLQKPATHDTLANLVRCLPSEYLLVDDPLNPAYNGFIVKNGGRLYIDAPFLEYATPECASVKDVTIYEEAGNYIVNAATTAYLEETGRTLRVYKMISDVEGEPQGEIPGYHENYGLPPDLYFNLFRLNFWPKESASKVLIPFLVTRTLYAGAGRLVPDSIGAHYELSQRAKWIETVFNYTTARHRPILHLKRPNLNETHLRVHITCGDPNMSQIATFLKIGTTALVLVSLGQGALRELNFELADPVEAFRSVSAHGLINLYLKRGSLISSLDIQESLLNEICEKEHTIAKPDRLEWDEIINEWRDALQGLRQYFRQSPHIGPTQ